MALNIFQIKIFHTKKKIICERNLGPTKAINAQVIQLQLTTNDFAFKAGDDILKDKNLMGSISKIIQEKLLKEDYLALEKAIRTGNETAKEEMKLLSSVKSQCTRQNSRVPSSHRIFALGNGSVADTAQHLRCERPLGWGAAWPGS